MSGERLMEWVREKAKEYCPKCDGYCCNTETHEIKLDPGGVQLFMEHGIPMVYTHELDEASFERWRKNRKDSVSYPNEESIPDPSIIGNMEIYPEYSLYANKDLFCPFYDKKGNLCEIYEDPNRPKSCEQYPIKSKEIPGTKITEVWITESCKYFNTSENREEMLKILNEE